MGTPLLLAMGAGLVAAVNPCGFAVLPAYLSLLVAADRTPPGTPGSVAVAVGRALRCAAALTAGFVLLFGAFGLLVAPAAAWLQPRLPWLTVGFGLAQVILGGILLAGRRPALPRLRARAPRLTGTTGSTVLFGSGYAVASLGCTVGPFLAIVVAALQTGSAPRAVALFLAYAAGMGLVVAVAAVAAALLRVALLARIRRLSAVLGRAAGLVLILAGSYVAYYGRYEIQLFGDGTGGPDPVVATATRLAHRLAAAVGGAGVVTLLAILVVLLALATQLSRRRATVTHTDARAPADLRRWRWPWRELAMRERPPSR